MCHICRDMFRTASDPNPMPKPAKSQLRTLKQSILGPSERCYAGSMADPVESHHERPRGHAHSNSCGPEAGGSR